MLRLCLLVSAASALKVTVLGGTGFVGSRVCHALATSSSSVEVVSVSRTGEVPEWCKGEDWTKQVSWVKNEFTRGSREKLQEAIGSPDAVVSCVGAIGVDQQGLLLGNGVANAEAAAAAKVVGAQRMAYVSVGSEVVASKGWCVAIRTPHLRRTAHPVTRHLTSRPGCPASSGPTSRGSKPPRRPWWLSSARMPASSSQASSTAETTSVCSRPASAAGAER